MTIYLIAPLKGEAFAAGQELLTVDRYPPNVRLVDFRRPGEYHRCGYAENDCADGIRADGVRRLCVTKASAISGWAQAVAVADRCKYATDSPDYLAYPCGVADCEKCCRDEEEFDRIHQVPDVPVVVKRKEVPGE